MRIEQKQESVIELEERTAIVVQNYIRHFYETIERYDRELQRMETQDPLGLESHPDNLYRVSEMDEWLQTTIQRIDEKLRLVSDVSLSPSSQKLKKARFDLLDIRNIIASQPGFTSVDLPKLFALLRQKKETKNSHE